MESIRLYTTPSITNHHKSVTIDWPLDMESIRLHTTPSIYQPTIPCPAAASPIPATLPAAGQSFHPTRLLHTYHCHHSRRRSQYPKRYQQRLHTESHNKRHHLRLFSNTSHPYSCTYRRPYQHHSRHTLYPLLSNKVLNLSSALSSSSPAYPQFVPQGTRAWLPLSAPSTSSFIHGLCRF